MLGRYAVLGFIAIIGMIIPNSAFAATDGFTDFFDPSNWTFSTQGNGFVDTSFAPDDILLVGSDDSDTCDEVFATPCNTDFTIGIPENGYVKFFWEYETFDFFAGGNNPLFDPAGITINGQFFQLTDNAGPAVQSGFAVVPLNQGDVFGFRIDSTDDLFGESAEILFEFMFVPENEGAYVSSARSGTEVIGQGFVGFANLDDGEIFEIGDQVVEGGLSGLTFDRNGDLFASAVFGGGSVGEFYQVDPITGESEFIGDFLLPLDKVTEGSDPDVRIKDLATQPGSDVIFGVGDVTKGSPLDCDSSSNALFTIDKSDATVTCVGNFATDDFGIDGIIEDRRFDGLAFAPDGTLFATGSFFVDGNGGDVDFLASFNPDASFAGFFLEVDRRLTGLGIRSSDGTFFATTTERESLHTIDLESGETPFVAGEGANLADVTFFPFAPGTSPGGGGNGGGDHESPTIGKNRAGNQIVKSKGICIDAQCWTVTEFDTDFKLLQLLTSRHTITNTVFCNEGVQECDSVGVAFMTSTDRFGELVMMVEAQKTGGEWIISWYDPQDFIHDPSDYPVGDPRGAITFTVQIVDDTGILSQNGNFLLTSFTIDFKNKNTGELVIRIQVGDEERGQGTFWFNEGVEFIDSDAYPSIETAFEESLEINSLCLNEDPDYRYSCAFAENRDLATQNAEETLWQMLNGEYIYK